MGCIRLIGGKKLLLAVFDKFWKRHRLCTIEGLSSGVLLTPHYAQLNKPVQLLRDAASKMLFKPNFKHFFIVPLCSSPRAWYHHHELVFGEGDDFL